MKTILVLVAALGLAAFGLAGPAGTADIEAGAELAGACAACHGENGVSVSDDIPNLAGQKAGYLAAQLTAFRAGARKNALMNAIAGQLEDAEIENVAAFFSGLPGATGTASSELLPDLAADKVTFPAGYETAFTRYTTIDFPDRKQVRHYYANRAALEGARRGGALPEGALLFVEVFKAKLDAEGKPVAGADGRFLADKLAAYTAMEKRAGWGKAVPEILRNGDWSYAVFTAEKIHKPDVNQATCLACHKPEADKDYVFSLTALREKARMAQ